MNLEKIRTHHLEQVKRKIQVTLSREMAACIDSEISEYSDPFNISGLVVERYTVSMFAERHTKEITVSQPSSWWQMFKRDLCPKWFKSRFPVKTTPFKINVERMFAFPNLPFEFHKGYYLINDTVKGQEI